MLILAFFFFFFENHEIQLINDLDQKLLVHTLIQLKIKRLKFKDTLITGNVFHLTFPFIFRKLNDYNVLKYMALDQHKKNYLFRFTKEKNY